MFLAISIGKKLFCLPLQVIFILALLGGCSTHHLSADLPEALRSVPAQELASQANFIFLGEFHTGRTPCQFLPDGSRRWYLTSGFTVVQAVRGWIAPPYIEIHLQTDSNFPRSIFSDGQQYFVLLSADKALESRLAEAEAITFRESLSDAQVLAVISTEGKVLLQPARDLEKSQNLTPELLNK